MEVFIEKIVNGGVNLILASLILIVGQWVAKKAKIFFDTKYGTNEQIRHMIQNLTCGQGARKSATKTALFRAPIALSVSIDLSA